MLSVTFPNTPLIQLFQKHNLSPLLGYDFLDKRILLSHLCVPQVV